MDKTQDVLDSAESGAVFERLYAQAILNPGDIEKNIDRLIAGSPGAGQAGDRRSVVLRRDGAGPDAGPAVEQPPAAVLGRTDDDRLPPLPKAARCSGTCSSYSLEWPDGSRMERVSFQSRDAQDKGLQHVSLEDARIRRLVQQLPRVVVTEPIPCVRFADLPAEVVGYWSLWRIALDNRSLRDVKIIPIFHHDDGRNPRTHGPAHLGRLDGGPARSRTGWHQDRRAKSRPSSVACDPKPNARAKTPSTSSMPGTSSD